MSRLLSTAVALVTQILLARWLGPDGNGLLAPFFDIDALSDQVVSVLSRPKAFKRMRAKARSFVRDNYDATRVCLPRMLTLVG